VGSVKLKNEYILRDKLLDGGGGGSAASLELTDHSQVDKLGFRLTFIGAS
jgi:hypothetical protein